MYGYQFEVTYDATKASAVGAFVNTLFDTTTDAWVNPTWAAVCTAGTCKFSVVKLDPGVAVTGDGTLVKITFTGVAPGVFPVTIGSDATLTDIDGELLARTLAGPLELTVCGSTTISGKVTLQGRSAGNVDSGTVELTDLDGNFPGPFSANFGNDGLFSLNVPVMPSGSNYQMDAKHGLYLTNQQKPALTYGVPLSNQNTRLWGGDANNTGKVEIDDLSCIGGSFGLTPPAPVAAWQRRHQCGRQGERPGSRRLPAATSTRNRRKPGDADRVIVLRCGWRRAEALRHPRLSRRRAHEPQIRQRHVAVFGGRVDRRGRAGHGADLG